MRQREKAHAALAHALDALGDGSGQSFWGPGPVGELLWRKNLVASCAFDDAAVVVFKSVPDTTKPLDAPRFIAAMRKLAPVMLDVRLDALGVE